MVSRILVIILSLLLFSACSFIDKFDSQPEMTSPCVGAEASPCGPKRAPVQQWLMQMQGINFSA